MRDQNDNNGGGDNNNSTNNNMGRNILIWLVVGLVLLGVVNMFSHPMAQGRELAYSDLLTAVGKGEVSSVTITGSTLSGEKTGGEQFFTIIPAGTDVVARIEGKGVSIKAARDEPSLLSILFPPCRWSC